MALRADRKESLVLTKYTKEFRNDDASYIADKVSPLLEVPKFTGKIAKSPQDHLKRHQTEIANQAATGRPPTVPIVDVGGRVFESFHCRPHALKALLTPEDWDEYDSKAEARKEMTQHITDILMLDREFRISAQLTLAANFTNVNAYADDTKRWDAFDKAPSDNSTPRKDIFSAIKDCRGSGLFPNLMALDWEPAQYLFNHPNFRDKEVQGGGPATPAKVSKYLADWFGIKKVLVANAMYVSGPVTASTTWETMSPVWGKDVFLGHIKEKPQRKDLFTSATWSVKPGRVGRNWKENEQPDSEYVEVYEWGIDEILFYELSGYIFTDVIQ
jgi:hypothetical protein